MSPQYANLGLSQSQDRPIVQALGSLNANVGFATTLGLEYSYQRFRTEGTAHQVSITATSRSADLRIRANREREMNLPGWIPALLLALPIVLGGSADTFAAGCVLNATPIAFGNYRSLRSADLVSVGIISYTCTGVRE
jgi:hypothetical protein